MPSSRIALRYALTALRGVGDALQQWTEWTGYTAHVRRRVTPAEMLTCGDLRDLRQTEEAAQLLCKTKPFLPIQAYQLGLMEIQEKAS